MDVFTGKQFLLRDSKSFLYIQLPPVERGCLMAKRKKNSNNLMANRWLVQLIENFLLKESDSRHVKFRGIGRRGTFLLNTRTISAQYTQFI